MTGRSALMERAGMNGSSRLLVKGLGGLFTRDHAFIGAHPWLHQGRSSKSRCLRVSENTGSPNGRPVFRMYCMLLHSVTDRTGCLHKEDLCPKLKRLNDFPNKIRIITLCRERPARNDSLRSRSDSDGDLPARGGSAFGGNPKLCLGGDSNSKSLAGTSTSN